MSSNTRSKSWPWTVSIFLLGATALSYLDRQALAVVAPQIAEELQLDNSELGLLLSVFFYSYGAMHLFVGFFLDRLNIRFVYAAFVALWSLAQMFTGFAQGFMSICAARIGLGTFESAGQPGAARIIARILPAKDRSFANGIMMSGGSIGALLAPVLMIWMANRWGWRTGFVVLGALGLVWALAWVFWFRPPAEVLRGATANGKTLTEADRWDVIFRNPKFWACVTGAMFGIPIIHIASAWTPTYFVQEWGLSLNAALAGYLFLIYLGRDLGFLIGGAAVSFLTKRGVGVGKARKRVLSVAAVLMLAIAAAPWAPTVWVAVGLIFLLEIGRAAYGANFLAFNQDIAPGRVGTIAGWMGAIGAFSGAFLVWLIGVLSEGAGFRIPFLLVGGCALAGVLPLLLVNWDLDNAE
jgi:MFS transporter, ACS family, aldohexuronate transporter